MGSNSRGRQVPELEGREKAIDPATTRKRHRACVRACAQRPAPEEVEGTSATGYRSDPSWESRKRVLNATFISATPFLDSGRVDHCTIAKTDSRYLKTGPQRTSRRRQGSSRITRSEGPSSHARGRLPGRARSRSKTSAVSQTGAGHQQGRAWSAQALRHGSVVDFPHYRCCDVPFQLRINPRPSAFSLHTQTLRPVTVISLISGLPKVELDNLSNAAPRPRFDPAAV